MKKVARTLTGELVEWASALELEDVPPRVVSRAKSQLLSQLGAARAGLSHPLGEALVRAFGSPLQPDPRRAASVLAGLTSWLHFDDTAYAGHLSHSTIGVPVAYARALELDGRALLTAVIAANECAARVTAAATLGPFRGQTAAHTHLAGAVAGRLRAEDAPPEQWLNAIGLAFGMPPRTLYRGFLGSDAKVLSAFLPTRMALDACDGARAGLVGAADILEHPDGFIEQFSDVPLPASLTSGLGTRWHTETLSYKVRPGGPGLDSALDCATELAQQLDGLEPDAVEEVVVQASLYTVAANERTEPYLDGSDSPISALLLSIPYAVATALLTGDCRPLDYTTPALVDRRRWALAQKVRVEHDEAMTLRFLLSAIPIGEALREAGERAADWLRPVAGGHTDMLTAYIAAPSETFEDAEKVTPARVTVRLADGTTLTRERDIPVGAAGPDTRARHETITREKFLSCGGSAEVADGLAAMEGASAGEISDLIEGALS